MVGRTKPMTKAQQRRTDRMKRDVGCICCRILSHGYVPAELHHIVRGGRRLGHDESYPLCDYHHRGRGYPRGGPSLAHGRKPFEAFFGKEQDLKAAADNLLAEVEAQTIGRVA